MPEALTPHLSAEGKWFPCPTLLPCVPESLLRVTVEFGREKVKPGKAAAGSWRVKLAWQPPIPDGAA